MVGMNNAINRPAKMHRDLTAISDATGNDLVCRARKSSPEFLAECEKAIASGDIARARDLFRQANYAVFDTL